MANDLGIASSVAIEGWVEGEARERVMRKAWVLVLPSHVEALPMAVLESLAAGVPVVASRVGGVPALVEDERHGLLVDARDVPGIAHALQRILTDLPLRKAMGRSARDRAVTEFSSELIVPRVEALWREIAPAQEIHTRATAT
jgi:glycosyltransferase involved in cell wall biosynthesis